MCSQHNPAGIDSFTVLGKEKISSQYRTQELLVDYTFKTNQQKLELFVIVASWMQVGFFDEYFLLKSGTGGGLKFREKSTLFFLHQTKHCYLELESRFVLNDKERA